uniref:Uncharacterized protein n=1 Tax=Oryza nivara TaxID=4536 RepID=A0A0E0HS39_ORYNI
MATTPLGGRGQSKREPMEMSARRSSTAKSMLEKEGTVIDGEGAEREESSSVRTAASRTHIRSSSSMSMMMIGWDLCPDLVREKPPPSYRGPAIAHPSCHSLVACQCGKRWEEAEPHAAAGGRGRRALLVLPRVSVLLLLASVDTGVEEADEVDKAHTTDEENVDLTRMTEKCTTMACGMDPTNPKKNMVILCSEECLSSSSKKKLELARTSSLLEMTKNAYKVMVLTCAVSQGI